MAFIECYLIAFFCYGHLFNCSVLRSTPQQAKPRYLLRFNSWAGPGALQRPRNAGFWWMVWRLQRWKPRRSSANDAFKGAGLVKIIQGPIIKTRSLGPTNSRGSRYVAEHKRDSTTKWRRIISKHYGSSEWENHRNAAQELIENSPMNEWGIMIVCAGYDSDGYYWIVADSPYPPA